MQAALDRRYGSDEAAKAEVLAAMDHFSRVADLQKKIDAENRRTMLIPASSDFRPESPDKKLELFISLDKNSIKPGEFLRFHLELRNSGGAPVHYQELSPSLFKFGGLANSEILRFTATDPAGNAIELTPGLGRHIASGSPSSFQEMDPSTLENLSVEADAQRHFGMVIGPGETLRSLGDGDSAETKFRILNCYEEFVIPGNYTLQAKIDDSEIAQIYASLARESKSPGKRYVYEALGTIRSNIVRFTVER